MIYECDELGEGPGLPKMEQPVVPWWKEKIASLEQALRESRDEVAFLKDSPAAELPRLVACAIIIRDGKVLLEKRAPAGIVGLDNHWDLPGGKVEAGETVLTCAVREIKEELDIEVEPISLCSEPLPSTWIYPNRGPRHWCLVGVVCNIVKGEPQTHDLLQWFPIGSLPESLLDADRILIGQYLNAKEERDSLRAQLEQSQQFAAQLESNIKFLNERVEKSEATVAELSKPVTDQLWSLASQLAEDPATAELGDKLGEYLASCQPKASQPEDSQ